MYERRISRWLTIGLAILGAFSAAQAAYISIDDSHPDLITIMAGDFEGGFFVNGSLLTTGLGASASITLPDEGYFIEGSWIDNGGALDAVVSVLFALASDPTFATSGIDFSAASDGTFATLTGSIGGFVDPTLYFPTVGTTFLQDGRTELGSAAFLSVSFTSEPVAPVPEPGTLALIGGAILALTGRRWRQVAAAHGH